MFLPSSSAIVLSIFALLFNGGCMVALAQNATFPALFVFGDSIVDPGNNNGISALAKCNFPPYGRDFQGGKPTGRFSNGKIPTDFAAELLGIKELLPAYLDPNIQLQDLLTGVSFASGGAGFDPLTSKIASVYSLSDQLDFFKEYKEKIKSAIGGEEQVASFISKSLFFVCSGSNDIANTYLIRSAEYDIGSYTDLAVSSASQFFQELFKAGVRKVAVLGLPPMGCVPSQRTLRGGITRGCADDLNQAALLYNSKLSAQMGRLKKSLPDLTIAYVDLYNPLMNIIQNPQKYGFEKANVGCCATGKIEAAVLCNPLSEKLSCPDASKFIFWDSFHPTEKTYEILTPIIINQNMKQFF